MHGIVEGVKEAQEQFPNTVNKTFSFYSNAGVKDVEWMFRRLRCNEKKIPYMETERELELIKRRKSCIVQDEVL